MKPVNRVALDRVGKYRVSTVFLGIDHNFTNEGPPVLWETMVFEGEGYIELFMDRYTSREDAEEGHRKTVDRLKRGETP